MRHSGTELINPSAVLARAGIVPGWHVADMGCGALGHFVFPAARLVGGSGKVYAVDIQKTALCAIERAAKSEQHWNVVPVWSDIEVAQAAKIPSASIDLTLLSNTLYLSQNRSGLVQEAFRLAKPGGLLLVIEWKKEQTALGPAYGDRLDAEEARGHFAIEGLAEVDAFEAGDCHYALLYQKAPSEPMVRVESVSHSYESA